MSFCVLLHDLNKRNAEIELWEGETRLIKSILLGQLNEGQDAKALVGIVETKKRLADTIRTNGVSWVVSGRLKALIEKMRPYGLLFHEIIPVWLMMERILFSS